MSGFLSPSAAFHEPEIPRVERLCFVIGLLLLKVTDGAVDDAIGPVRSRQPSRTRTRSLGTPLRNAVTTGVRRAHVVRNFSTPRDNHLVRGCGEQLRTKASDL